MASRKRSISRSVACSLAALLLLSGCMFIVSTFQSDSEEWVLVEDEVIADYGVYSSMSPANQIDDYLAEYTFDFDEETSTYTVDVTGGTRNTSTTGNIYFFTCSEDFDFSKNYKFVVTSSACSFDGFRYTTGSEWRSVFNLKSVESNDDGSYTASIVILDQLVTDLSYQDNFSISVLGESASTTYDTNTMTIQLYELQTDNTGSIAAGITGLIMIVCGVFAMPMHNILRRR